MLVFGYILVVVWFTATGEIQGEALDYFYSASNCWEAVMWEMENSEPGYSYTCIPEGITPE